MRIQHDTNILRALFEFVSSRFYQQNINVNKKQQYV